MTSPSLTQVLLVGGGGFLGSVSRYLMSAWVRRVVPETVSLAAGTAAVNVLGCFVIGLLAGLAEHRQLLGPDARTFLVIGLLGGFTTFSSFAYETFTLWREGQALAALINVAAQIVLGLAAAWAGHAVAG